MVIGIGRMVVKIAGRDAGKKAVVVDTVEKNYVLIDGETRRRKCNISHLEPLGKTLDIKKGASHEEVAAALKGEGISVRESKPKKAGERPRKVRKQKEKVVEAEEKKVEKK